MNPRDRQSPASALCAAARRSKMDKLELVGVRSWNSFRVEATYQRGHHSVCNQSLTKLLLKAHRNTYLCKSLTLTSLRNIETK